MACGGPAPQALNFWPSCERRGGAATVLKLRDRGEQGSRNPVLFGWLLAYAKQASRCHLLRWALLALVLCVLPSCSACCCCCTCCCCCCCCCTCCNSFCRWAASPLAVLPWLSSFSSCGVLLVQVPCFSPSHSKIRSSNRHAVALGNRKRRRHRRPFSRAARPGAISFLQEVNLHRETEAAERAFEANEAKAGGTDSKSTGGATNSSGSRAGNEDGLAVGTSKKGAK